MLTQISLQLTNEMNIVLVELSKARGVSKNRTIEELLKNNRRVKQTAKEMGVVIPERRQPGNPKGK